MKCNYTRQIEKGMPCPYLKILLFFIEDFIVIRQMNETSKIKKGPSHCEPMSWCSATAINIYGSSLD